MPSPSPPIAPSPSFSPAHTSHLLSQAGPKQLHVAEGNNHTIALMGFPWMQQSQVSMGSHISQRAGHLSLTGSLSHLLRWMTSLPMSPTYLPPPTVSSDDLASYLVEKIQATRSKAPPASHHPCSSLRYLHSFSPYFNLPWWRKCPQAQQRLVLLLGFESHPIDPSQPSEGPHFPSYALYGTCQSPSLSTRSFPSTDKDARMPTLIKKARLDLSSAYTILYAPLTAKFAKSYRHTIFPSSYFALLLFFFYLLYFSRNF